MALKTPNVLIEVDGLSGRPQLTLPKAVQRDPIRGGIEHVDLIMVRRGEKVTVEIPVQVTGEVEPGGLLDQQMVRLAVEAEATQIPQAIEVDVEGMEIGSAVHAGLGPAQRRHAGGRARGSRAACAGGADRRADRGRAGETPAAEEVSAAPDAVPDASEAAAESLRADPLRPAV